MPNWVDFHLVKQVVSLEAVLRIYNVPLRRNRDQLKGCCPIHRGKRADSFQASLSRNVFHCFACQASGNVLDFVAAMEKCSIREAALRLQEWFGIRALPRSPVLPRKGQLVREKEKCNPVLHFALTGLDHSHPYLANRGILPATALEFGVGFYAGPGLLSGRTVIPICNARGQTVAYAGRALDGSTPKYKLPPGFRKALEIFNLHRAAATFTDSVIVVEGFFGCLWVHQAGLPWVVALMGSSLSTDQENALVERFHRIVLLLDGDTAGRAASQAIAARLLRICLVTVVHLPNDLQPDQLSAFAIHQLLENLDISHRVP